MSDPRGGIPIADAAAQLGVTVELLRKRAQRKTIPAYKADGRWFIVLDAGLDRDGVSSRTDQDETFGPGRPLSWTVEQAQTVASVPIAARAQLDAIRDDWLQPLIDQLKEQAERIGRLEAERDIVIGERDALRQRVAEMETGQHEIVIASRQDAPGAVEQADATEEPATGFRAWWRRLWGGS